MLLYCKNAMQLLYLTNKNKQYDRDNAIAWHWLRTRLWTNSAILNSFGEVALRTKTVNVVWVSHKQVALFKKLTSDQSIHNFKRGEVNCLQKICLEQKLRQDLYLERFSGFIFDLFKFESNTSYPEGSKANPVGDNFGFFQRRAEERSTTVEDLPSLVWTI